MTQKISSRSLAPLVRNARYSGKNSYTTVQELSLALVLSKALEIRTHTHTHTHTHTELQTRNNFDSRLNTSED